MARVRKWPLACAALATVGVTAYLAAGTALVSPARVDVGPPPIQWEAQSTEIQSRSGTRLSAWVVPGRCRCGVVVVLHGVRSNREGVANRVELLHDAGYAVVAPDLQAHGESGGEQITFGYRERFDAEAAVAFARSQFPGQPVGVIGVSLGGAAAALAGSDLDADAVVLEAVYPDIESATRNRLRIRAGGVGASLSPVLLAQLPLRTGVQTADLRPVEAVGTLGAPVLVVAGTQDRHTTPADTERLYEAAHTPKAIWWVRGAAHVDFLDYAPEQYRAHVLGFLREHLFLRAG